MEENKQSIDLSFKLHPRQGRALMSKATELLYGGAASSGKSHLARVLAITWCLEIPGLQVYLFRRLYDDLIKNHLEGPTGFRAILAPWCNAKHPQSPLTAGRLCEIIEGEIRFWNGSKIFLCHLQHQKDITKYYGPDFHVLILEEATQFSEFMVRFLRSRLRIPKGLKIPDKYMKPREEWTDPNEPSYYFPRAVYTSNPGGIGHQYFKQGFITEHQANTLFRASEEDGGHIREFIPAKVDDNPSVNREEVKKNLAGLPPALVDAMLNGNWNAVVGAFFPEIQLELHTVPQFQIPDWWIRTMSMDWGACGEGDPFAINWWATSDGSIPSIPRGALVCYRRFYGAKLPKVTASWVASQIVIKEAGEFISQRVAGGDILEKRGHGPSIFEIFSDAGIVFSRADMRRASGWMQVRERLVGKDGKPMIYWMRGGPNLGLESLMQLQHDMNNPNDAAAGEDHEADSVRYECASRPWVRPKPAQVKTLEEKYTPPTISQLWALKESQDKRGNRWGRERRR